MNEIIVPKSKFEEMEKKISCQQITEGYVKETVMYGGKEYVVSGAIWRGELTELDIYQVLDLSRYKGELKPLEYGIHFLEVGKGTRERCYKGMLTKCGRRQLVFVSNSIKVLQSKEGTQTLLFS